VRRPATRARCHSDHVIVVCGEAIVDLVPDPGDPVRFTATPGGSPANTAVAVARLGSRVGLMARLSRDGFGALLRHHLAANGVDLSAAVAAGEPSSVALAAIGPDGAAGYRFLVDGAADWQWDDAELRRLPDAATAVHTGSLSLALAPGAAAIERMLLAARHRCTLSLDPNIRPHLTHDLAESRDTVERCVGIADVVKASADDLAELYPGRAPLDIAAEWAGAGPGLVVITRGPAGAVGLTPDGVRVAVEAVDVPVVDTIGAGDSFAAGLLDWLARSERLGGRIGPMSAADVEAALRFAAGCAAVTCSRRGADPPWRREIED